MPRGAWHCLARAWHRFHSPPPTSVSCPFPPPDHHLHRHAPPHHRRRDPPGLHRVLREEGRSHLRALEPRRPARRPDAPLHERGDEPVQGRVPRPRQARLHARGEHAEVHPRRRQAQRPRGCRQGHLSPHLLRDAGELVVRRLLQGGVDPLGLRAPDDGVRTRSEPALRDLVRGERRRRPRARPRGEGDLGVAPAEGPCDSRQHEGQLLGDGRDGSMRTLHRDPLRPDRRTQRGEPRELGRSRRPRDLEPRVHPVQPRARPLAQAAAGEARRHRHGPRAARERDPGQAFELRHRPVGAGLRGDPRADGRASLRREARRPHRHRVPRDRRPHPLPDDGAHRRRESVERGPRLRAAPHPAPRGAPWPPDARRARAVPQGPRARGGREPRRRVPRARTRGEARGAARRGGGDPVREDARARARALRRRRGAREGGGAAARSPPTTRSACTTPGASRSTSRR